MSYFAHRSAAARYARSRPYFHPLVMARIREEIGITAPLTQALDVGCGTGQSTVAVRSLARFVIGTDISPAMLAAAPHDTDIAYIVGAAEGLPCGDARFDLVTAGLAFHWFDQGRFLAEARRVLRPGGWLVPYNNGFHGVMHENAEFAAWVRGVYLARYPSPPRPNMPLDATDAERAGFCLIGREVYENTVIFSADELADYLLTQSNVIAAVEQGSEQLNDVRAWIRASVAPFFAEPRGTFAFGGDIQYLRAG
jgi:SAM-dependent methyltransferase